MWKVLVSAPRTCRGCDGTGCTMSYRPYDGHTHIVMACCCGACLGAGVVVDVIPAADALADAETLWLNASTYMRLIAPHGLDWWAGAASYGAITGYEHTAWYAVRAARAAFHAVPGLRGE